MGSVGLAPHSKHQSDWPTPTLRQQSLQSLGDSVDGSAVVGEGGDSEVARRRFVSDV